MIVGIISDIHEDVERLKEALTLFEKEGVDEIICLGDIVGYSIPYYNYLKSRNANEVISLIKANCKDVVIGNHDLYSIKKIPNNRSFFDYPNNWYDLDFQTRKEISDHKIFLYEHDELSALLSQSSRSYLESLPEYIVKNYGDHSVLLTHYAFPDCTGSSTWVVKDREGLEKHFDFMQENGCLYGFSGNDHFEGFQLITEQSSKDYSFGETYSFKEELTWLHGPTLSRGTFHNGVMIYDANKRIMRAIGLGSDKHIVPDNI